MQGIRISEVFTEEKVIVDIVFRDENFKKPAHGAKRSHFHTDRDQFIACTTCKITLDMIKTAHELTEVEEIQNFLLVDRTASNVFNYVQSAIDQCDELVSISLEIRAASEPRYIKFLESLDKIQLDKYMEFRNITLKIPEFHWFSVGPHSKLFWANIEIKIPKNFGKDMYKLFLQYDA